jgi:hypothetical protein
VADATPVVLDRRSRALVRDLTVMEQLLEQVDRGLRDRLRSAVKTRLATTKAEANELVAHVKDVPDDRAGGWAWLHAMQTEVDDLLDECLRLVAGAAARTLEHDDGYCRIADALVDELVATTPVEHWSSFTIMGRSEQYSRASRMIEVRAPASTVWELPVVVHELGHFVGPMLVRQAGFGSEHPLDTLFETCGDGTAVSWSWIQELFADVFAAYVIGPAYGFTCCLEVFDPLLSHLPTDSHPPAEQRMRAILMTLRGAGTENDRWAADRIGESWTALVEVAGGAEGRDPVVDAPYADQLVRLVEDHLPISRWAGWAAALAEEARLTSGASGGASDRPTIADVVNAAWLARLKEPTRRGIDDIGRRAFERIRHLTEGDE